MVCCASSPLCIGQEPFFSSSSCRSQVWNWARTGQISNRNDHVLEGYSLFCSVKGSFPNEFLNTCLLLSLQTGRQYILVILRPAFPLMQSMQTSVDWNTRSGTGSLAANSSISTTLLIVYKIFIFFQDLHCPPKTYQTYIMQKLKNIKRISLNL